LGVRYDIAIPEYQQMLLDKAVSKRFCCPILAIRSESDHIGYRSPGIVSILFPKVLCHGQDFIALALALSTTLQTAVNKLLDRPDLKVRPAIQIYNRSCHTYNNG
jgi:hypothetical protein